MTGRITDEELVRDAHTYAREVMKHVGQDKAEFLNTLDDGAYLAWALSLHFEVSRLMLISLMSAGVPHFAWDQYFGTMANQALVHLQPENKAEGVRQARQVAAKLDLPTEGVVN